MVEPVAGSYWLKTHKLFVCAMHQRKGSVCQKPTWRIQTTAVNVPTVSLLSSNDHPHLDWAWQYQILKRPRKLLPKHIITSSIANSPRNSPFLLQVLTCSFASTRKFVCEYSRVGLWVLASSFASTHEHTRVVRLQHTCEFRLACAQWITRVYLRTHANDTWVLCYEWRESLAHVCQVASEQHCTPFQDSTH